MKKIISIGIILLAILIPAMKAEAKSLFPEKDKYVIVIDPGHGGENLGTVANENFEEKEMKKRMKELKDAIELAKNTKCDNFTINYQKEEFDSDYVQDVYDLVQSKQ